MLPSYTMMFTSLVLSPSPTSHSPSSQYPTAAVGQGSLVQPVVKASYSYEEMLVKTHTTHTQEEHQLVL